MSDDEPLSRRGLLKSTVAAAASGALLAQTGAFGQAPAAKTRKRFKAWISRGDGPGRTTLQEATLRPIGGRQVVVRTEATNLCYSNVPAVLGLQPPAGARPSALAAAPGARRLNDMAVIQGHGGIGIVEAVGPEVRRVQVGDRVCVSGTPHCGVCYRCLRGRSDMCQFLSAIGADDLVAIADLKDGTPVYQNSHIGGLAELMVTFEEWVVPIFTKLPAADVGMVVQLRRGRRSRRDDRARADADRACVERRRRRLRAARTERDPGRADRGRDDDHRHRSDRRAARSGDEGRRDARARSERRRRWARHARALAHDVAHVAALVRRPQSGRSPPRRRRGLSSSRPRASSTCRRGSSTARIRPGCCRCSRRIRCARSAGT